MSKRPENMDRLSEALSEVMDDIGVNETLVMRRRNAMLLVESINNISFHPVEKTSFIFGSQSEGSTILGLHSDLDTLVCYKECNIVQRWSECIPAVQNYKMVQNENISPGYCYLQPIRSDIPFPVTVNDLPHYMLILHAIGDNGRILMKHRTSLAPKVWHQAEDHGPALTFPEEHGYAPTDRVYAFYSEAPPHQVKTWLRNRRKRSSTWPTKDVLKKCESAGCFVVQVGSKVHSPDALESKLEWRISTSLQERYLMFSLNMTQLRCFILMKLILKTHMLSLHIEGILSSFICKNVLLYCISNSSHDWNTGNLLAYLHLCFHMLKECVVHRNCPHFIIPENNLLAGRMTDTQRGKLLDFIDNLMADNEQLLFAIQFDDLGKRLKMKLNNVSDFSNVQSPRLISMVLSYRLVLSNSMALTDSVRELLNEIKHSNLERAQQFLFQRFSILKRYRNKDKLQYTARELLLPTVSSVLGSVMASADIEAHLAISNQALAYLEAGKDSDALSGRLKLISVLYCTGNMRRALKELNCENFLTIDLRKVQSRCYCYGRLPLNENLRIMRCLASFEYYNEQAIKFYVAFCIRFLPCEINCIPKELRFEILRSFMEENRTTRSWIDSQWMDFVVVDSMPYLFFLEYKVYKHLKIGLEPQLNALQLLASSIKAEASLGHKETAFNLLGQCLEQEGRQREALGCYIASLKHRRTNNAVRFLICIQLYKLLKQQNMS